MSVMKGRLTPNGPALCLILVVAVSMSCSRPTGLKPEDSAQTDPHQVPFQDPAAAPGNAAPAPQLSTSKEQERKKTQKQDSPVSPRDSQDIPAGTLVVVRLKNPISSEYPGEKLNFSAVVDQPVLVDGNTLIPRGSKVSGRVESSRASQLRRNRGYIRLKLEAVDLDGRHLPVQTSSLFVHGNADGPDPDIDNSSQAIHLEGGRRLTFRLNEPLSFASGSPPNP
jgi:hypothetical protein